MRRAGFVLARARAALYAGSFWAWQAIEGGFAARIETDAEDAAWLDVLRRLAPAGAAVITMTDASEGVYRAAFVADGRLSAALFLTPRREDLSWMPLKTAWSAGRIEPAMRRMMLSGLTPGGARDEGPNVCACFGVPRGAIEAAIGAGCADVAAIGKALKAGTNCGSCIPELKRMLACAAPPSLALGEPRAAPTLTGACPG